MQINLPYTVSKYVQDGYITKIGFTHQMTGEVIWISICGDGDSCILDLENFLEEATEDGGLIGREINNTIDRHVERE